MDLIKYFQRSFPAMLAVDKRYSFRVIASVLLSCETLQIVFELRDESGNTCLLLQAFEVGSQRYQDLVDRVFDLDLMDGGVAEVTSTSFLYWSGETCLRMNADGGLEIDLDTIDDFELPVSALREA